MKEGDLVEFWSGQDGGIWKPAIVAGKVKFYTEYNSDERRGGRNNSEIRLMTGLGVFIFRSAKKIRMRANNEPDEHIHEHRVKVLRSSRGDEETT